MKTLIFSDINDTIKPENGNITAQCIDAIKMLQSKDMDKLFCLLPVFTGNQYQLRKF